MIESLLISKRHWFPESVEQWSLKLFLIAAGYRLVRCLYVVIPPRVARTCFEPAVDGPDLSALDMLR
jgi:hypothetical protein